MYPIYRGLDLHVFLTYNSMTLSMLVIRERNSIIWLPLLQQVQCQTWAQTCWWSEWIYWGAQNVVSSQWPIPYPQWIDVNCDNPLVTSSWKCSQTRPCESSEMLSLHDGFPRRLWNQKKTNITFYLNIKTCIFLSHYLIPGEQDGLSG